MTRMILKHLSGSRSSQVSEFPLDQFSELTIGRDPSSTISYDPNVDDLVGRHHARITPDASDASQFVVTDLNSRNGTFVNRQRIIGSARIAPGDVIQLGPGGPEMEFDLDPRPANFVRPTREADSASAVALPPTREADAALPATNAVRVATAAPGSSSFQGLSGMSLSPATSGGARSSVGKLTVERMISQVRGESRKFLIGAGAALVVLLVLVVGLWMREPVDASGGVMSPEQIAQKNVGSVVWFEVSWKLIHTGTGNQIYHQHKSVKTDRGVERVPLYITTDGRSYEPVLTLSSAGNAPIGGSHGGSGFVITSDGFILTNRHVAAAWYAPYDLPGGIVIDDKGNEVGTVRSGPANWIPAQAIRNRRSLTDKPLEGRNDILNVTFPENKLRIPAQPARISDEHDVAMVKINLPDAVPKVEMYDNYDSIKQGAPIVVIGYPLGANLAPVSVRVQGKAGGLGPGDQAAFVPEPTVTSGIIGRVIKSGADPTNYYSAYGDTYQHTAATNPGNSGGPVFDQHGRVIAIHNAGVKSVQGANFAVPIKYGIDLMGTKPVKR